MKSQNYILNQANEVYPDLVDFLKRALAGVGEGQDKVVDQLRVMGHLGQAMVDMSNHELALVRLQQEEDKPKVVLVS